GTSTRRTGLERQMNLPVEKKGGPETTPGRGRAIDSLERNRRFQLDQTRRSVATQERAHDAGWHAYRVADKSELRVRNIPHGLIEIWMVQQVEELQADSKRAGFRDWQLEVLLHREIGIEETWPVKLVAALLTEAVGSRSERCRVR